MKKNILIILSIVLLCNLQAQAKKDYAYYNKLIDSLTVAYSINKPTGWMGNRFFFFEKENLSIKEKKKILAKIRKMFEQTAYSNLYGFGSELLYDIYFNQKDKSPLEIRQIIMELYLQYYFYPQIGYSFVRSYDLESYFDYTVKAKKRIREILEGKKTKEEYISYFTYNRTYYNDPKIGWDEAAIIMKTREVKDATVLKQLRDSIVETYVVRDAKREFAAAQIKPNLIKMIGLLEMKECIPTLKQKLAEYINNGSYYSDEEEACRYALAQLGDEEQRQYILDSLMVHSYFDQNGYVQTNFISAADFSYFQDDEFIWKYIDVNYGSGKMVSGRFSGKIPMDYRIMSEVYPYIKNVPEELKYPDMSHDEREIEQIWPQKLYKWLMENKNCIEFDYEGEKKSPGY
jgi:hypothetical protein